MLLDGKTIIVTGGNSGIGEAIVLAAAAEGANIVIDYVAHPEETDQLIAKIEAAGGHAVGRPGRRQQGRRPRTDDPRPRSTPSAAST